MICRISKGLVFGITGLALLLLQASPAAFAQADRGSIVGTVRDASGGVVPNATVTVTNKATNVTTTAVSNSAGEYQALALLPATYTVKVSASGFETQVQDNVPIDVQTRQEVDFSLKVGSVQQEVMVTASEPLLQTQTADIGGVVHEQQIVDLPLNGRRYADLALLEPGVQKYYNANNPSPDRFSVNGNLELQNDFLLDGVDNNSNSENLQEFSVQVVQPPPDAVQEFRIQTRTYSAEFGTSAGAVINATIKSGTNGLHGDLWEFIRNDNLDANDFFSNASGTPIGHYTQNQFGGTVGGPIRKDKTFFFFDYQRFTARRAQTVLSTIPTPLMLTGNFTELPFALQNPSVPGETSCITNNIVNPACQDPVAQKLLALYPSPNIPGREAVQGQPGSFALGVPNYIFQAATPNDTYSLDGRIDHTINDKNHLFGRYSFDHVSRQDPSWTSNHVVGDGNFATQYRIKTQQLAIGLTTALSNSMVNEIRGGWNRDFAHSDPLGVTLGTSLAPTFGLNGIPVGPNTSGLPPIYVGGLNPIRLGGSPWRPQYQIAQVYQLVDNLSWLKGKHSFKFGYEYHKWGDNFLDIRSLQGEFGSLFGQYTDPTGQGFAVADFLLGNQDFARFTTPLVVHNYQPGHSFYGQDTWRATSKLTLTYGLRWELFAPVLNRQNETSNFSPAGGGSLVTSPSNASGWAARSLINPDYTSFAPRFGFAYHALNRVVLRGGYGVFFQHEERIGSESILQLNPPFLRDSQTSIFGGSTTVFQLQNGFPLNNFTGGPLDLAGIQFRAQDPNQRNPYVEQASFGPEIELSRDTVLGLTYVGNWARKANRLRNGNEGIITSFDSFGCPIVNFPYANLNDQNTVVDTGSAGGCSLPGGHGFLEYATNDGNTNYNALEVSLRRAFTRGLSYGVSYTWSHGLANYVDNLTGGAFPANGYNYSLEYGNSQIDITHRFVANAVYELPFGKGRQWLSQGGVAGKLAGGWQANSIVTIQTGTPFSVGAPDLSFTDGSGNDAGRPNCVGNAFAGAASSATGPNGYVGSGSGFFLNPSAFTLQAPGTFGTCAPRQFYGPGLWDVDFSVFRSFRVGESKRFEFRTEVFNAFNHPNFANPGPSVGNPSSFTVQSLLNPILGLGSGGPGDPREIQFALKFYF
ncbi:MAG TPA: carboxypeptidase regulatory-like domain-containing protein [Terriglobia bacterium]|nr:carboxypeptidase regulatory-like domain-containing protein [Terriglobia bacterium]